LKLNALLKKFLVALGPGDTYAQWMDDVAIYEESPRRRRLQHDLNYYLGMQYDDRKANWDGHQLMGADKAQASRLGALSGKPAYGTAPAYLRVPYVQRQIVPSVVRRLTGLLFSENLEPLTKSADPNGQPFISALIKSAKFWQRWADARNLGGGGGSVAVGVGLIDGLPVVELAQGVNCDPVFKNGNVELGVLAGIRIAYWHEVTRVDYVKDTWGRSIPKTVTALEYYCRVITDMVDVQMVSPDKKEWALLNEPVYHNLGYCPWVWVRNEPILNEQDGRPDCAGCYPQIEQIDYILSQGAVGTRINCDPTLVLRTKQEVGNLSTGSGTVLILPGDSDEATLLETKGDGGKIALEYAKDLKEGVLEDCRVVLDEGRASGRSATEMIKRTESMHEHASDLRTVYGPACERSLEMLLGILRKTPQQKWCSCLQDYPIPDTDDVDLTWPEMLQVSPQEKLFEIQAASAAIASCILSRQTARTNLASSLGITDVEAEGDLVRAELAIYGAPGATAGKPPSGNPGTPPAAPGVPTPAEGGPDGSSGATFPLTPPLEGLYRDFPGAMTFYVVDGDYVCANPSTIPEVVDDPDQGQVPWSSDDFSEAMNDQRAPCLGRGVGWLDDRVSVTDYPYFMLHEMVEAREMLVNGRTYVDAHTNFAVPAETYARQHPDQAEALLAQAVADLAAARKVMGRSA